MPGSTSNLSVDEQQAIVIVAKKKEDVMAAAQAAATTVHRDQEALIAAVAVARKTLYEARARDHAAVLTWDKEKTITRHMEQQFAAA
jgi:uncharacterized protein YqgV (UPF0045/DUF77 family)